MKNSDKKKNNLGILAGAFTTLIIILIIKLTFFKAQGFDKMMMQAAGEINKSCPIMVDEITRLDNTIALPDKVFQYNYTIISLDKDSIDAEELKSAMEPNILNNVRTNPDLKSQRDNKVTMAYSYRDKNGVFMFKISITPDQYRDSD